MKKKPQRDNYQRGFDAFSKVDRSGKYPYVFANPNRPNTTPYREWERGFNAAYFKNLEKLEDGLTTRIG
jgi:hypothetical protein